jgi:hypothetical protein
MRSAAPSGNGADLCFLGSYVVTKVWLSCCPGSGSSSSYSSVMCRIWALPLGLKFHLSLKVLVYHVNWFGFIVASTARNGGPLMNFIIQFIFRLKSLSQGYLRIRQSRPRSVMMNLSMRDISPWNIATGSQCLTVPPLLSDLSMFLMLIGGSSSCGLILSFFAVRMSMQFSFAPQSTRAFSWTIP